MSDKWVFEWYIVIFAVLIFISMFSEDPNHSLDILYLLPLWRCQDCGSVLLRGVGDKVRKETVYKCNLCKEGVFNEFENAAIGDIVINDTYEKVGKLTKELPSLPQHWNAPNIPFPPQKNPPLP